MSGTTCRPQAAGNTLVVPSCSPSRPREEGICDCAGGKIENGQLGILGFGEGGIL